MASVTKRPDGKYRARYRDPAGREHAKHFDRKVDADRWLRGQETAKDRGEWIDPRLGMLTFAEWAAQWESTIVDLRPATLDRDTRAVRNHLVPRFGPMQLARITTSEVKAWVAEMNSATVTKTDEATGDETKERKFSPATVRKSGQILGKVLGAAVAEGLIARSPCVGVKLPAEGSRDMVFLTADQVVELVDATHEHYRVLVATAAYLGLRWGELVGLRTDRVDLLRGQVSVVEQITEVAGRLEVGPPKTTAGRRSVSVPSFLVEMWTEQLEERAEPGGLMFPAREGGPMRRSNFRRRCWAAATKKAGVAPLRFHDLRHTAVALAIGQGAHPKAIQERMGHSSITTTLDRYGHLFPALDEQIADGLDSLWRTAADQVRTERASGVAELRATGTENTV